MKNLTQKSSGQFVGAAMRVVTLALFLAVFGAGAALAQTRGYVANVFDSTVSVIDPATNAVVATIPVGDHPEAIAFGVRAQGPTDKDQCKDGGWQTFADPTFSNQGECIRFVNRLN